MKSFSRSIIDSRNIMKESHATDKMYELPQSRSTLAADLEKGAKFCDGMRRGRCRAAFLLLLLHVRLIGQAPQLSTALTSHNAHDVESLWQAVWTLK